MQFVLNGVNKTLANCLDSDMNRKLANGATFLQTIKIPWCLSIRMEADSSVVLPYSHYSCSLINLLL